MKITVSITGKLRVNGRDVSELIQGIFKTCSDTLEGFQRTDTRRRFLDLMTEAGREREAHAILNHIPTNTP